MSEALFFIRLRGNAVLTRLIKPHLKRPVGRPPKSGVQIKYVDLEYQAKSWDKPRRVVAKIEWHLGELFPRYYFILTNSRLPAGSTEVVYTEKWLAKIWQERYFQNVRKKGVQAIFGMV